MTLRISPWTFLPLLGGVLLLSSCAETLSPASTGGAGGTVTATSTGGAGGTVTAAGGAIAAGAGGSGTGGTDGGGGSTNAGGTATGGGNGSGGAGSGGGSGGSVSDLRTFVYVGSGDWNGAEPGLVTVYQLDREARALTFVSEHAAGKLASFLAVDQERLRLFAGDEADGGVSSFTIDAASGQLTPLGSTASENHPVYLKVTGDGAHLVTANYNEGKAEVYPIASSGKAGAPTSSLATGSQSHCVAIDAQNHVFVPNKGGNTISRLTFVDGALAAAAPPTIAHASPRHLFLQGDKGYLVSEEADTITGFTVTADGNLTELWQVPRLPSGVGSAATDTGADVRVTPSGKFLYATNRGNSNTIVAYDLQTPTPTLLEHEPSLGTTPRNFSMDPEEEFIVVGNHGTTKTMVVFAIGADGRLTPATTLNVDFSPYFVGIAQF